MIKKHTIFDFVINVMVIYGITVISIVLGSLAIALAVPVMLVCSFLPMLSMFNDGIGKAAKYFYSEQLYLMINQSGAIEIGTETVIILGTNVFVIPGCFILAYRNAFTK